MAQFTVAIALLSALSVSALGGSSILIMNETRPNPGVHGLALGVSMLMFTTVLVLCLFATVSRALDFRLTARKVRGKHCLTMFGLGSKQFGSISWLCFWSAFFLFLGAGLLFSASFGYVLAAELLVGK